MVSLPLSTYRKSRAKCKCSLTYIIAFFDMRSNLKVGSFARKSGFSAPVGGKKSYNLSKLGLHSSLKQWVGCDPWLYTHTHTHTHTEYFPLGQSPQLLIASCNPPHSFDFHVHWYSAKKHQHGQMLHTEYLRRSLSPEVQAENAKHIHINMSYIYDFFRAISVSQTLMQ